MTAHPKSLIPVVPPRLINDIFSDEENERLFHVLKTKGPWRLIAAIYFKTAEELLAVSSRGPDTDGSKPTLEDFLSLAFRGFFGNNGLSYHDETHEVFYSHKLLNLVKDMHGAQYGAPYLFQFNAQGPSGGYDPGHFDGRSWRGLDPTNMPAWLGSVMAKSGLFDAWEVKAGQVISYYYRSDIDGGFTYWPNGPDQAPERFAAPFWNSGIITDNQHMYHRGEACGPRHKRELPSGTTLQSVLQSDGGDGWNVVDGDRVVAHYPEQEMRFLFHYSAHVFTDMADLKRYYDHTDDLSSEQAIGMLIDDLRRQRIPFEMPTDPMSDPAFIATLTKAYAVSPAAYHPQAPLDIRQKKAA
jgi:hypothetical protein